ncbi:unnamed protein product [Parajaminaea phylloscopi]
MQHWLPILEQERQASANLLASPAHATANRSDVEALALQLQEHWQVNRPTERQQKQRDLVIGQVQSCIDRKWPGRELKVAPFGSSVTGIVAANSDIDLVLLDGARPLGVGTPAHLIQESSLPEALQLNGMPEWYDVRTVAKVLRKYGMSASQDSARPWFKAIFPIDGANVPIVSFEDTSMNLSLDLNINDRFGLANSHMIRAYATLRPRTFRQLCFAVKKWLKRRKLNDPSGRQGGGASLSSYSIVLIIIQYYQVKGLLPNLQNAALLAAQGVSQHVLYRAPKLPRRKAGDPKSGSDADIRKPKAERYDVTFLDVNKPDLAGTILVSGTRSFRHWCRAETEQEQRALDSINASEWDQQREADPAVWGTLPSASDVGLHEVETVDSDSCARAELGKDFIGFVQWYSALEKRGNIIDIKHGQPLKANNDASRRRWQAKNGYQRLDGGASAGADTEDSKSGEEIAGTTALEKRASDLEDSTEEGTNPPAADTGVLAPAASATAEGAARPQSPDEEQILLPEPTAADVASDAEEYDPDQPVEWLSDRILIRDPFIRDRNTAKNMGRQSADRLEKEFGRAVRMLTTRHKEATPGPPLLSELWVPLEYEEAVHEEKMQAQRDERAKERTGETLDDMVASMELNAALDAVDSTSSHHKRWPTQPKSRIRHLFTEEDDEGRGGRGGRGRGRGAVRGRGRGQGPRRGGGGGGGGSTSDDRPTKPPVKPGKASRRAEPSSSSSSGFDSAVPTIFLPNRGRAVRGGAGGAARTGQDADF